MLEKCILKMHFSVCTVRKEKCFFLPVMEWIPFRAEWAPGVLNKGMFMLSIKRWTVIKTHFYLNECKLAHLLWWASCPDSSISMIDQLSSCWWLTGNGSWGMDGGREGVGSRKRDERAWGKKWIGNCPKPSKNQVLYLTWLK